MKAADDPRPPVEDLDAVLHRGRTWAVTAFGVEKHSGTAYAIERARLGERLYGLLEWPLHIAEKGAAGRDGDAGWYDFHDFVEVFEVALRLHAGSYGEIPSPELVRRSLAAARAEHRRDSGHRPAEGGAM